MVHRHGFYRRYAGVRGEGRVRVQRYRCPGCGHTLSVLPSSRLPYRPVSVARLQDFLDGAAGMGSGPDPPPCAVEEGCLLRALRCLEARATHLTETLGQLLTGFAEKAGLPWRRMRLHLGPLPSILLWLGRAGKTSLLGDYLCLRYRGSPAAPL